MGFFQKIYDRMAESELGKVILEMEKEITQLEFLLAASKDEVGNLEAKLKKECEFSANKRGSCCLMRRHELLLRQRDALEVQIDKMRCRKNCKNADNNFGSKQCELIDGIENEKCPCKNWELKK